MNKVKRVNGKTENAGVNDYLNNPKGIKFQHRDEFGLMWEQTYQYVQFATSLSDVMHAKYLIKLQVKVGSLMQT